MTATSGNRRKSVVERLLKITPASDPTWTGISLYYKMFINNLLIVELLLQQHERGAVNILLAELAKLLLFRGTNVTLSDMQAGRKRLKDVLMSISELNEPLFLLLDWRSPSRSVDFLDLRLTALHLAVDRGYIGVARELIKMGADVNKTISTSEPINPLNIAVKNRDRDMMALLVREGAKMIEGSDGPLLHCAINHRNKEMVTLLLDTGATTINDYKDKDGLTALLVAVKRGYLDMAKLCIDYKADVNMRSKNEETALFFATKNVDERMVKLLLESGSIICNAMIVADCYNLLEFAIKLRQETIAKMLIERGAQCWFLCNNDADCIRIKNTAIKLLAELTFMNPSMLNLVDPFLNSMRVLMPDRKREYYELCLLELTRMRQETIFSHVTFHDLMSSKNANKIAAYCRNEEFQNRLSKSGFERMFPIYSTTLAHKYDEARFRAALLETAEEAFMGLKQFALPAVCAQKVFEFLEDKELMNFIRGIRGCAQWQRTVENSKVNKVYIF